jgi:hypothetical protein
LPRHFTARREPGGASSCKVFRWNLVSTPASTGLRQKSASRLGVAESRHGMLKGEPDSGHAPELANHFPGPALATPHDLFRNDPLHRVPCPARTVKAELVSDSVSNCAARRRSLRQSHPVSARAVGSKAGWGCNSVRTPTDAQGAVAAPCTANAARRARGTRPATPHTTEDPSATMYCQAAPRFTQQADRRVSSVSPDHYRYLRISGLRSRQHHAARLLAGGCVAS